MIQYCSENAVNVVPGGTMGARWNLSAAEVALSEAAVDPSQWDAAMEAVSEATGSFGAAVFPIGGRLPSVPQSRSLAAAFETYVRDGWIHRDERDRTAPILARARVATELDFTTTDEIRRHPYYQEFLAPHGLRWFAGVIMRSGDDQWCLSIQRSIAQGPFSAREQLQLAALSTRISGAVALSRALGFARADAALGAFEVSNSAVVLLDRCAEVLQVNGAAQRLLGPDLQITRKRLTLRDRDANAALDRALHALLWAQTSSALMPPVVLPRDGKRPLLAYPMRLSAVSSNALAPCQALVVLVDLDARPHPPENALSVSFGLTAAEARLAVRIATGASLESVADEIGIALETARHQLKAIFAKTDTHRQAELVSVMARLLSFPPFQRPG
jgi:DNA-binding CsgD family transcriptional regulator